MSELLAGRYRVLRELGSGAMGVVWEAHDEVLDRLVALKELRPPTGLDREAAVQRFLTEARAAARLKHANIITVHDVVSDGGRVLMALEYLDGPTFAQLPLPLDPATARGLLAQVAGALAEAHANGIVHRDLKPDNVFALADGRAVVCDFGLARIGAGTGTQAGTVMGTPGYLAPEQVRGEAVGPAADVFAWGALGYELLTGSPAFGSPELDPATLLYNVVHVDPAPLTAAGDPDLVALVGQSLSKDPAARPPSGIELFQALTGVAPASGWVAPAPAGMSTPSQGPWNPGVTSFVPPGTPSQAPMMVPARGKAGLIAGIAGLVVAVLALAVALAVVVGGGGGGGNDDNGVAARSGKDETRIAIATAPTSPPSATAPPTTPPSVIEQLSPSGIRAIAERQSSRQRCNNNEVNSYSAFNLIDGSDQTGWGAGANDGTGASATITFDAPVQLTQIGLTPGYTKVGPRAAQNCQAVSAWQFNRFVTAVEYRFDDGTTVTQSFTNDPVMQFIDVNVRTENVVLTILGTQRPPGADDDTILSEINFRGHR